MKVRIDLNLNNDEKQALLRFAIAKSYLRIEPRKVWKEKEIAEACRYAIAAIVSDLGKKQLLLEE